MFALLLAALVVGPEQPVSVPYRISSVHNSQSIATNGSDVVIAWVDQRSGSRDVYTARLTPEGQVQEFTPLTYGASATNAKVIYDGSTFRVFWNDAANEWTLLDAAPVSGGVVLLERDRLSRLALRRDGSSTRDVFESGAVPIGVTSEFVVWLKGDGASASAYEQRLGGDGTRVGLPVEVAKNVWSARIAPGLIATTNAPLNTTTITRVAPNGVLTQVTQLPFGYLDGFASTGDGGFIVIKLDELIRYDSNGNIVAIEYGGFTPEAATVVGGNLFAIGRSPYPSQFVAYASGQLTEIAPQYDVQTKVAIASDGTDVLTLWHSSEEATPIAAMPARTTPALSFDRDHYTAAFTNEVGGVFIATLGRGGVAIEPAKFAGVTDDDHAVVGGFTAAWRNSLLQNRIAYWSFLNQTAAAPNLDPGVAAVATWSGTLAAITLLGDLVVMPADGRAQLLGHATGPALTMADDLIVYQDANGLEARFIGNTPVHLADEIVGQPAAASAGDAFVVTWANAYGVFAARIVNNSVADVIPVSADGRNPAIAPINGGVIIAYERRAAELGYTARVFTRTLLRSRHRAASH